MDQQHKERMRINAVVKELELEMAEQDYQNEKRNAAKEFEEKKVETENAILHQKRMYSMGVLSSLAPV